MTLNYTWMSTSVTIVTQVVIFVTRSHSIALYTKVPQKLIRKAQRLDWRQELVTYGISFFPSRRYQPGEKGLTITSEWRDYSWSRRGYYQSKESCHPILEPATSAPASVQEALVSQPNTVDRIIASMHPRFQLSKTTEAVAREETNAGFRPKDGTTGDSRKRPATGRGGATRIKSGSAPRHVGVQLPTPMATTKGHMVRVYGVGLITCGLTEKGCVITDVGHPLEFNTEWKTEEINEWIEGLFKEPWHFLNAQFGDPDDDAGLFHWVLLARDRSKLYVFKQNGIITGNDLDVAKGSKGQGWKNYNLFFGTRNHIPEYVQKNWGLYAQRALDGHPVALTDYEGDESITDEGSLKEDSEFAVVSRRRHNITYKGKGKGRARLLTPSDDEVLVNDHGDTMDADADEAEDGGPLKSSKLLAKMSSMSVMSDVEAEIDEDALDGLSDDEDEILPESKKARKKKSKNAVQKGTTKGLGEGKGKNKETKRKRSKSKRKSSRGQAFFDKLEGTLPADAYIPTSDDERPVVKRQRLTRSTSSSKSISVAAPIIDLSDSDVDLPATLSGILRSSPEIQELPAPSSSTHGPASGLSLGLSQADVAGPSTVITRPRPRPVARKNTSEGFAKPKPVAYDPWK
ncbi:hypothetical protein EWM64_g9197 [Hericium alpestre]|uniref:Uncharacterized protein n=1 Tax=Hericium alpestre TaxID=135208 RepID=A0A4Y9ZJP0_9AGAM|nr:hypothetical protein EWM64_g9197 [Hericium alpestre]